MSEFWDESRYEGPPRAEMHIRCPNCGRRFRGGRSAIGKTARCKLCGHKFLVSRRRETSSREKGRVAAACPHCGAKRKIPSSQLDKETVCDRCGRQYIARRTSDTTSSDSLLDRLRSGPLSPLDLAGKEPADSLDPARINQQVREALGVGERETRGLAAVLDAEWGRGGFAFSPDGRRLAAAVSDRRAAQFGVTASRREIPAGLLLWDAATGQRAEDLRTAGEPPAHCESVSFSPDSRFLAATDGDLVPLWDLETGEKAETLALRDFHLASEVAFSPDGRTIAAGCDVGGTLTVWDGCLVLEIHTQQERVHSIAFHPDGHRIASAGDDETIRLWDASAGQQLAVLEGHRDAVWGVAFSPFGRALASAGADGAVRLWSAATGRPERILPGHSGGAWCVAFSPHGDRLASSGADGMTRVWDSESGALLEETPLGGANCVAFSPTGRFLALHHQRWICILRLDAN